MAKTTNRNVDTHNKPKPWEWGWWRKVFTRKINPRAEIIDTEEKKTTKKKEGRLAEARAIKQNEENTTAEGRRITVKYPN